MKKINLAITGCLGRMGQELIKKILEDKKKVQPLDNDFFLIKRFFDSLLLKIRNYFNVNTEMKVADFKDLTGLTRKTAIPVLEYLDKNRYTNRKDNIRLIGEAFNE